MTISLHVRLILKFLLSLLILAPNLAYAHTGVEEAAGRAHGLFHPFTGLDHFFAMIAVGLWAAQLGGRAQWLRLAGASIALFGGALCFIG